MIFHDAIEALSRLRGMETVFLVGNGMSQTVGSQSWNAILEDAALQAKLDPADVADLPLPEQFDVITRGKSAEKLTRLALRQVAKMCRNVDDSARTRAKKNECLDALRKVTQSLLSSSGSVNILTTNYDHVLEILFDKKYLPSRGSDIVGNTKHRLHIYDAGSRNIVITKIHGDSLYKNV